MRILELDNRYGTRFLVQRNIDYFTVRWESGDLQCFPISDNTIKIKDGNKTRIVYKDAKFTFSNISVAYHEPDSSTLNWIGIYVEKLNTFLKNPIYTGPIDVNEIINKLQGK